MKTITLFIWLSLPAVAFGQSGSGIEKQTSVSLIHEASSFIKSVDRK
jgi:hypothetical protein